MQFYFITDAELTKRDIFTDVQIALESGIKIVQYREKKKSNSEKICEAKKIRELTQKFSAKFIINDDINLALEIGADGVHLGQEDEDFQKVKSMVPKNFIIGVSTHSLEQAIAAEKLGADYIGCGPIFSTKTKKNAGDAVGVSLLEKVCQNVKIPVVAIGGINCENLSQLSKANPQYVAIISDFITANNLAEKIKTAQKIR